MAKASPFFPFAALSRFKGSTSSTTAPLPPIAFNISMQMSPRAAGAEDRREPCPSRPSPTFWSALNAAVRPEQANGCILNGSKPSMSTFEIFWMRLAVDLIRVSGHCDVSLRSWAWRTGSRRRGGIPRIGRSRSRDRPDRFCQ